MSDIPFVRCKLINSPISPFHVSNIDQCIQEFMQRTETLDKETLISININSDGQIINLHLVSLGTRHSTMTDIVDIFRTALLSEADIIAVAHNHPEGDNHPSKADIAIMKRLVLAGYFVDVPVTDGFIVGTNGIFSFRKNFSEVFDISL